MNPQNEQPWDEPRSGYSRPVDRGGNYNDPRDNYTNPQYAPQEYSRERPVADEQPKIFRLRDEPDVLVYEYSDRLDYYRRTAQGNEFLRRKFK